MTRGIFRTFAASLLLSVAAVGFASAVDTSCVGVQLLSAEQRYARLAAAEQARLAPVMERLRQMAREVEGQVRPTEEAYEAAERAYRAAHPGLSEDALWESMLQSLTGDERMDFALANHFEVQALIHLVEVRMVVAASVMPSTGDRELLGQITSQYAQGDGAGAHMIRAAMRDGSAYGQLLATLAVAEAAETGSAIPAGALVGRRFDDAVIDDPQVVAARAATDIVLTLNAGRLGDDLLRGPIEQNLRVAPAARAEMMQASTRAADVLSDQFGREVISRNAREFAVAQLARASRPPATSAAQSTTPPPQQTAPPATRPAQPAVAHTAEQTIQAVRVIRRIQITELTGAQAELPTSADEPSPQGEAQ